MFLGFFLFGFLFLGAGLRAQTQVPHNAEAYECLRAGYAAQGVSLDSLMTAFEADLSDAGLLPSPDGAGYRALLQQVASGLRLDSWGGPYFSQRAGRSAYGFGNETALSSCREQWARIRSREPDALLTRFLDRRDALLLAETPADLQASALLDLLDNIALEAPFYRLQTYYLLELQADASAEAVRHLQGLLPGGALEPTLGANLMHIYLNERDQLILDDQLITPERLKGRILEHARRFGPQARYRVAPEPDVKFRNVTRLKDQIAVAVTEARDQFARQVFGKPLGSLSPEEAAWVNTQYPLEIRLF